MVLCINKDRYIIWTNEDDSVKEEYFNDDSSVIVIKNLQLDPPDIRAGFSPVMYLNDDLKTVRYEYIENGEPMQVELTPLELLGQQLSDLEIQQLEYNAQATQEREFLGQQLSDLEISMLERGL